MRTRRSWISAIVFAVAAPAALHAEAPLGTSFTYQGQLKQAGLPVTGDADMIFHLWDAETGGGLYDSYGVALIPVVDGLFTVELDFGPDPFEGDARWLEIEVEFPSGEGNWTTLSPRQPITATPYALYALNGPGSGGHWAATGDDIYNTNSGNVGIGTTSPSSKLDVHGHVRISSGSILSLDGSAVENYLEHVGDGLSTIGTPGLTIRGDEFVSVSCGPGGEVIHIDEYGIVGIGMDNPSSLLDVNGRVESSSGGFRFPDGTTQTTAASGDGHSLDAADGDPVDALYVDNDGEVGIGTDSPSYPLHVENASPDGIAIFGLADNSDPSSTGIGVYGRSDSDGGSGVYGEAPYLTGSAYGVRGVSAYGTGVQGERQDTGNFGALGRQFEGVYGESAYGVSGIGVHGKWTGSYPGFGYGGAFATTSHLAAGVLGINEATEAGGSGVIGIHEHTTGWGYGVRGETASAGGHGVRGDNQISGNYGRLGGGQYGVEGHGNTAGGYFEDSNGSGYAYVGYGDRGIWASGSDAGGYFEAGGSLGRGVYAEVNNPGSGLKYAGYFVCDSETGYGVYASVNGDYTNWAFRGEATGPGSEGAWFSTTGVDTRAVYGNASASTGENNFNVGGEFLAAGNMGYGVRAIATGESGTGVSASATGEYGVGLVARGGASGYAAIFKGNVQIQSRDTSETLVELGEGLDYAEGFDVSQASQIVPGTVLIIDPDNPGKLTISNRPYDTRVAGIVAGANGLGSGVRLGASGFDHDVALAGRVYCNVVATDGAIEPGDLLTTSDIPGYAAKVTNHQRAQGAVLGKAMERLEKGEKGRILVLVTLQ